ncbi:hypothetical protein NDU88_005417 [Pleurodeles waltl]|uniref:Uncharacterized protein n=1 Tax=Pleurodeles waltl TaxID=8319 RepID=A0AAV7LLE4_PLEWA|nr:hypothetical protein NDU88_005417 [Pleurodeles waltl]
MEWPPVGNYRSEQRTAEEKSPEGLVSSVTAGGVPWLLNGLGAPRVKTARRKALAEAWPRDGESLDQLQPAGEACLSLRTGRKRTRPNNEVRGGWCPMV